MTATPHRARSRGRELALLTLFHLESYPAEERDAAVTLLFENPPGEGESELVAMLADSEVRTFAAELLQKVNARLGDIDTVIEAVSRSWRMSRMDRVDRNLLRLAVVELDEFPTPRPVVLAESVRLAARYGSEHSAAFVNGVVESLAKRLRPSEGQVEGHD